MNTPDISNSPYYFAIRRPVTATMIIVTAVVFGLLSYRLLPINILPKITYPSLTVRTEYPGAAPEEVESIVTKPLEQALGVVRHVVEMSSSSRAQYSDVILEFDWDTNMNDATQDVREKLDLVFLPQEIKPPLILRYDPSLDPLLRIGLTSDSMNLRELRKLSEDLLKRELEKLSGVAAVKVKGGEEEEIRIALDLTSVDRYNIDFEHILQRLASENVNIAGGSLREGKSEFMIRTLNEFRSLEEIRSIVIDRDGSEDLRILDVATVSRDAKDVKTITRIGGTPSVELEVFKESDANPIAVSDLIKHRLYGLDGADRAKKANARNQMGRKIRIRSLASQLTERVRIHVLTDQADFIRLAVDEVRSAALLGGLLAIAVLFLFLGRVRDTLIVAVVIPISLICTFAAMHLAKVSINVMSLGGLALGIGMMVDNAIVVIESIYRRHELGEDPVTASVHGARVVGTAVIASTLTTIVVFFPIVFVSGVAGQVFGDMALTVIISLGVSLLIALYFIPMLTTLGAGPAKQPLEGAGQAKLPLDYRLPIRNLKRSLRVWKALPTFGRRIVLPFVFSYLFVRFLFHWLVYLKMILIFGILMSFKWIYRRALVPTGGTFNEVMQKGGRLFRHAIQAMTNQYARLLSLFLDRSIVLLALLTAICVFSYGALLSRLGGELIPTMSQGQFEVQLTLPVGTPVGKTASIVRQLELDAMRLQHVRKVSSRSGGDLIHAEMRETGPNIAHLTVLLESGGDLELRERIVVDSIRSWASTIPSLDMLVKHPTLFTFKQPIELIIRGEDLEHLKKTSNRSKAVLASLPMLADVESSIRPGHPEAVVRFHRDRLARLGLSAKQVAERIQTAVKGSVPTRFRELDRRVDIRVQLEADRRRSLQDLNRIVINPAQEIPVMLSEVADIEIQEGPAEIDHFSSNRAATLTASVRGTDLNAADDAIHEALDGLGLIVGRDYLVLGQRREMEESLASLRFALMLAVFLVYVVIASQFESFKYPFLILLTIPLAIAGVLIILWAFAIPLSIMVFLGLIVLAGIMVNDSIILVDYANRRIREGNDVREALIEAGKVRFRPILMTSMTTILALLPMALGVGEGVEMRRPMAVTVIFGLFFSTFVSLIAIPTLMMIITRRTRQND